MDDTYYEDMLEVYSPAPVNEPIIPDDPENDSTCCSYPRDEGGRCMACWEMG